MDRFFWFSFLVHRSQFKVRILVLRICLYTFLIPILRILDFSLSLKGISKIKARLRMTIVEFMSYQAPFYCIIVVFLSIVGYR